MKTKPLHNPQLFEIYSSIEDQIPDDNRMKLVDTLIDQVDLSDVCATYKSGGCPPYDPRALLKAIIFAFINNTYSSRKIAKCISYDARYQWLAGHYKPSYRTILRFISDHLKGNLGEVFSNIVSILLENGYIDIAQVYVDGTTLESRASRYSIVWKKTVKRYSQNNTEKIKALISQIFETSQAEGRGIYTDNFSEMISDEDISICTNALAALNESELRGHKSVVTELNNRLQKAEGYNKSLKALGERNSLSKTDTDAIGMHPKDDVKRQGPCLAMHNLQIITNSQFVLGLGLFTSASDSCTLPTMLNLLMGNLDPHTGVAFNGKGAIKELTADAGYGSLANVEACEACHIIPYLKYSGYENPNRNKFNIEAMPYDAQEDTYTCPNGKKLRCISTRQVQEEKGARHTYATYRSDDCTDCPLKEKCIKKGTPYKESKICIQWRQEKEKLKRRLDSPRGQTLIKKRSQEPEPVFGIQKWDHQYKRFRHFSRSGIITDLILLFIAHNIDKAYALGMKWQLLSKKDLKIAILKLCTLECRKICPALAA